MNAKQLFEQAQQAGLSLRVDGDRLVVRGPKKWKSLVKELIDHKLEIISLLQAPSGDLHDPLLTGDGTKTSTFRPNIEVSSPSTLVTVAVEKRQVSQVSRTCRLIGCGFPSYPPSVVPDAILAKPIKTHSSSARPSLDEFPPGAMENGR